MLVRFRRTLLIIISLIQLASTECILPVKGIPSLENDYKKTHEHLAHCVIDSQIPQIVTKITRLQQMKETISYLAAATERLKSSSENREKYVAEQKAFIEISTKEFKRLFGTEFSVETDYGELFLQKILDGIKIGNYDELFASLPKAFDVPMFNTFACAFSFLHEDGTVTDIFPSPLNEINGDLKILGNTPVFISGESKLTFATTAIRVQSSALGGSLTREIFGKRVDGLESAFRHSEQKAFVYLFDFKINNFIWSQLSRKPKIKEIIFHGCTLRDMCPNCCATLTSHEMLAYNIEVGYEVKQESFLILFQKSISKKQNGEIPKVTSIISSLIRYYPENDEPISWLSETHTSLLNEAEMSPKGITSRFVNQFRFAEKDFLEYLIAGLQKKIDSDGQQPGSEYIGKLLAALNERKSSLDKRS